jgi:hypothetical protein
MKYYEFLLNEDAVSKALGLPEPKVGGDYPSEKVKRYIKMIDAALAAMKNKEENEANDAIVGDLRDKKKKWKNVDKETEPKKTITEPPPDQGEEEPPPEDQQQPPPEKKPQEQPQEGKLKRFLGGETI